jgi:hypothetical protein
MDIKIKVWLLDIQQAIEAVFLFLGEKEISSPIKKI